MKNTVLFIAITLPVLFSCRKASEAKIENCRFDYDPDSFATSTYKIPMVKGQLLYIAAYSNLPNEKYSGSSDLKVYLVIHNTDLKNSIQITKTLYFDQGGRPVSDLLRGKTISLGPLATKDFQIPYEDKSGIGANFLLEWISKDPVTGPLIESVSMNLRTNQSISISSVGKVIREIR